MRVPTFEGRPLGSVDPAAGAVVADPILSVHVLAGVLALLAGIAAITTPKGGVRHNRAGTLYVVTMAIVVVTAMLLSVRIDSWFLFAIAVFTGYLIAAGYRLVHRRRTSVNGPTETDYALQGTMIAAGAGMVGGGGYGTATGTMDLGPVLIVFGLIGGVLAARELRQFHAPVPKRTPWFERHIAFMGGGYIATVTATITVNLTMVPALFRWLGPTLVGVPLIFYAIETYRPRFDRTGV